MINEALRQFEDIHTHVVGNANAVCSLSPKEAMALSRAATPQPYSIMLHPWLANENLLAEFLEAVEVCASDPRFVAVGECGLDATCATPLHVQRQCLEAALRAAHRCHKPVILHIVKTWDALLEITREVFGAGGAAAAESEGCRLIIHGFRKNLVLAQQLVAHGYYISLGKRYNPQVLAGISQDRLYRETDDSAM